MAAQPERMSLRPTPERMRASELGMCSDQGPDGTCAFHSLAKILVQNVCTKLFDLTMNEREKEIYKKCLADYPIETEEDIRPYTAEKCTEKGFISIMFFYYFYFYLRRNGFKSLIQAIPLLDTMPARAAAVSPLDTSFSQVAAMMIAKKRENDLTWRSILIRMNREEDRDTYMDTIREVIEPIAKLGLYVYMLLNNHGVVLMNAHHGHFIIKNSWGYENDVVPYGFDIRLHGKDKVYSLEYFELFLPMTNTFSRENKTLGVYTSDEFIHVHDLYPFIRKYVATYQRAGSKTRRKRRKKTYTRLVYRLRQ
jgi:hypothetical protein